MIRNLLFVLLTFLIITPAHAARGIDNERGVTAESNGGLPVNLQDQTTPPIFVKMSNVTNTTTLGAVVAIDDTSITVASDVGINVGDYLGLFNLVTDRFYVGTVLAKPGANVLNLDTPVDSIFSIGDTVGTGITNMASVDGTIGSPVIFSVRGADPGIDVTVDITRIIITCIADNPVDLTTFGDIAGGITNGLVLRRRDGFQFNHLNWKTNRDIVGSMYDWNPFVATNPAQGVDGFAARLTYGGQSKVGVVIRLAPGEEYEALVQDLLNTLGLNSLEIMVEGHVVTD